MTLLSPVASIFYRPRHHNPSLAVLDLSEIEQ
jgi:hypothetical protein